MLQLSPIVRERALFVATSIKYTVNIEQVDMALIRQSTVGKNRASGRIIGGREHAVQILSQRACQSGY